MSRFSPEETTNLLQRDPIRFLQQDHSARLADRAIPPTTSYWAPSRIGVITRLLGDRLAERTTHLRDIQLVAECTPAAEGYFGVRTNQQRKRRVQEAAEDTERRLVTWEAMRLVIRGDVTMGVSELEIVMCEDKDPEEGYTTYAFTVALKDRKGSNNTHPRIFFTSFFHYHYEDALSSYHEATTTVERDTCLERIMRIDVIVIITYLHEMQHLLCDRVSRTSLK